jgi:hypothetical protein
LVIGLLTSFLFASAAAIDITRFSQENASAQHSADATAMAVATDCVLSPTQDPEAADTYEKYRKYPTQEISEDTPIDLDSCSDGKVTITVEKDVDSGLFLNRDTGRVHKTAEVTFGRLLSASTVIPVAIAACEFDEALLDGTTNIKLYFDNPSPNDGCQGLPGGFSELALGLTDTPDDPATPIDEHQCTVVPDETGELPGDPGKDHKKYQECINPTGATAPLNISALVPIYDSDTCTKANDCKGKGPYPVKGYAMFVIKGYRLQKTVMPPGESCADACLFGDFIRFVLPADLPDAVIGDPDPDNQFGGYAIRLSR